MATILQFMAEGSVAVQFKNWQAGIDSLPQIEVLGCIAHLTATGTSADRELYLRWRVPGLGVTIIGDLDVSAFHSMF